MTKLEEFNELLRLVNQENPDAENEYKLGRMYLYGEIEYGTDIYVVPADKPKALEYYQRAAQKNNNSALFDLGAHYLYIDPDKSLGYYRRAASNGDLDAQYTMAWHLINDKKGSVREPSIKATDINEGMNWLQRAADGGFFPAREWLGEIYEQGLYGIPQDDSKAITYFTLLAADARDQSEKERAQRHLYSLKSSVYFKSVDKLFTELANKITTIPHDLPEATEIADRLLSNLKGSKERFKYDANEWRTNQDKIWDDKARQNFISECGEMINEAMPVLERDLGWGPYLVNLIKKLASIVVTLGENSNFFPRTVSESERLVQDTYKKLSSGDHFEQTP